VSEPGVEAPPATPEEPATAEGRRKSLLSLDIDDTSKRAAPSGCGLLGGMVAMALFPCFLLGSMFFAWYGPALMLTTTDADHAVDALDDVSVAEERHFSQAGAYFAGPPWPRVAEYEPGSKCGVVVELTGSGGYSAVARCPAVEPTEIWQATDVLTPYRVGPPLDD